MLVPITGNKYGIQFPTVSIHSQDSRSISRELLRDERHGISIFSHYEKSGKVKEEREDGSRRLESPTSACGEESNERSPIFILPTKLLEVETNELTILA